MTVSETENTGLYVYPDDPAAPVTLWRSSFYQRIGKRILDVVLSAFLVVSIAPLLVVLTLLVCSDGYGPIFRHRRVGRNGKSFYCLKLRTMVPNAEEKLVGLIEQDPVAAEEWRRYQKLSNDPRVTKVGRLLRSTSLDELPQLFNVLRGEMSLVGPRPFTRSEATRFGAHLPLVLSMRPGITGPWQVSERNNDLEYEQRVRADVAYARNISFWTDMSLIVRTVGVVLARGGS